MSNDILYTPEEIANRLKITKNTVYEMIKRGDIDAHRIGKHLRISDAQYEIFLLKSRGTENVYESFIESKNGETFAKISQVDIRVNTELSGNCKISIRPEDIILSMGTFVSSARNMFKGTVTNILIESGSAKVVIDIGIPIVALITEKSLNEMGIINGTNLYCIFKTMSVKVFK